MHQPSAAWSYIQFGELGITTYLSYISGKTRIQLCVYIHILYIYIINMTYDSLSTWLMTLSLYIYIYQCVYVYIHVCRNIPIKRVTCICCTVKQEQMLSWDDSDGAAGPSHCRSTMIFSNSGMITVFWRIQTRLTNKRHQTTIYLGKL